MERIGAILPKSTGVIVADDDSMIRSILKGKLEAIEQEGAPGAGVA